MSQRHDRARAEAERRHRDAIARHAAALERLSAAVVGARLGVPVVGAGPTLILTEGSPLLRWMTHRDTSQGAHRVTVAPMTICELQCSTYQTTVSPMTRLNCFAKPRENKQNHTWCVTDPHAESIAEYLNATVEVGPGVPASSTETTLAPVDSHDQPMLKLKCLTRTVILKLSTTQHGYAVSQAVVLYTLTLQCSIHISLSGQQLQSTVKMGCPECDCWLIPNAHPPTMR